MSNITINLKDNLYMSLEAFPFNAKKLISGSLPYIEEKESVWYVHENEKKFRDYTRGNSWFEKAHQSLRSAVEKLVGSKDVNRIKFNIYSLN